MSQRDRYDYGLNAEIMVQKHYEERGFTLLASRKKTPFGELDLILQKNNLVVFVEVKARIAPSHEEHITARQVKRCLQAAEYYVNTGNFSDPNLDCRFDFALVINNKIDKIIENAA